MIIYSCKSISDRKVRLFIVFKILVRSINFSANFGIATYRGKYEETIRGHYSEK